ncbi:MAG: hypothetical protein IK990_04030 [Ruminiclostridium sp.]|nr:hypothetical protein [Ruminiclostridium sp.]
MSAEILLCNNAEYDKIKYGHMNPADAAAYLRSSNITVRSFSETLKAMYPKEDMPTRLTELFASVEPEMSPDALARKIRNWLSGRNQPQNREDIFRIAFALELTENELDHLLGLCTDYGIQYRDGRELTLAWCLRKGFDYFFADGLYRSLPVYDDMDGGNGLPAAVTHEIYDAFKYVENEDEFIQQYNKRLGSFGRLHVRSFRYFEKYYNNLVKPDSEIDIDERKYSVDTLMDKYLKLGIVYSRDRTKYSVIQKIVKKNWPNATSLKNIKNRVKDVPRKLLLLLYIVTENNIPYPEAYSEDNITGHWETVSAILADCGMAPLDPRNAFDWLMLYILSAEPEEAMSDKLETVIKELYGDIET